MGTILQLLISGIAMGFIYALVAIEYTLIWNSTGLLNFSHDKIITVGAYIFAATFIIKFNMNKPLAIVLTFMLMGILGSVIASGIFNPLRHMRSNIFAVMGTMMLGRILAEAIRLIYGPVPFTIENWLSGTIKIGTLMVTKANVIICVVAILVVAALQLFMNFTKIGKAMRCVAQNKKPRPLWHQCGPEHLRDNGSQLHYMQRHRNADHTAVQYFHHHAASIGLKGFSAGVIGGFGYLPGAILGGLFIGVVETWRWWFFRLSIKILCHLSC